MNPFSRQSGSLDRRQFGVTIASVASLDIVRMVGESAPGPDLADDKVLTERAAKKAFGRLSGANVWRGVNAFGPSVTPRQRQPFMSSQKIQSDDGANTNDDHVAHLIETRVTGPWVANQKPQSQFAFGLNVFTVTGTDPEDARGLQNLVGALVEADVASPSPVHIKNVIGLAAEASFFGWRSGATVDSIKSLQVNAPVRKNGATRGTAKYAYGLYVQAVKPEAVGAEHAYSVWVDGGIAHFGGDLEIAGTLRISDKIIATSASKNGASRGVTWGHGAPRGPAAVGSVYIRTDGGRRSTLYVKERGNGVAGWRAI